LREKVAAKQPDEGASWIEVIGGRLTGKQLR
jgi:hypothetical protein